MWYNYEVVNAMKKINFNKIFFGIMILLMIFFIGFLFYANIIPFKYMILLICILILWTATLFFLLIFKTERNKNKKRKAIGYVVSSLLIILMVLVFYYLNITLGFFKWFGDNKYKEENYLVLVLEDSNFLSLDDLSNVGYTSNELSNIDQALSKLNDKTTIENSKYDDIIKMLTDLVDKKIDSVLIEESSMAIIYEEHEDYEGLFRTIDTIKIKTQTIDTIK